MRATSWFLGAVLASAALACAGSGGEQPRNTSGEVGAEPEDSAAADGGGSNEAPSIADAGDAGSEAWWELATPEDIACAKLSLEECAEDVSCSVLEGYPVDVENSCMGPKEPVACLKANISCPEAISTVRAPDGQCWTFGDCSPLNPGWSATCKVEGWFDECVEE